jgi:hypothetical protein
MRLSFLVVEMFFFLNCLFFSSNSPFFCDGLDKLTNEIAAFEKVLFADFNIFNTDFVLP